MSGESTANSRSLAGKVVLVTGSTGGIGRASSLALARHGCILAVHYKSSQAEATALVDEITALELPNGARGRATAFQADLGDYDAVRRLHAEVVETVGHPDVLFNNAGTAQNKLGVAGDFLGLGMEVFESTWKINTGSAILLTQLCIPHMESQKWGRIIFNGSVAAALGGVIGPHYASSKSAIHGIIHWLAPRYITHRRCFNIRENIRG